MQLGQKFNYWTVIGTKYRVPDVHYKIPVRCKCGFEKNVWTSDLISGKSKSCGCHRRKVLEDRRTHGKSSTRLYKIWIGVKQRCNNSNDSAYHNYGGKGITICKEWLEFDTFYQWSISNGYSDNLTLDRIDNRGDYNPSNCQWLPKSEQIKEKRKPVRRSDGREYISISEAARDVGTSSSDICKVLKGHRRTSGGYGWEYVT